MRGGTRFPGRGETITRAISAPRPFKAERQEDSRDSVHILPVGSRFGGIFWGNAPERREPA